MPTADVAVLPGLAPSPINGVAVVFDVLRATTMMAALLDAGATGIRAVGEVETALECRQADPTVLLAGERGGIPPKGFDLGNSPVRIDPALVAGRTVVMTTTNGTAAVGRASEASVCLMGSLTNLDALAEALRSLDQNTLLICSGTDGGRSDEDELAAGLLLDRLRAWNRTDAADDVADRATGAIGASGGIPAAVERSWHARRLVELGFSDDVAYCARLSVTRTVPRLDPISGLIIPG